MHAVEPLIAVEDLAKRYGKRVALAGISFTVGPGEIVGLLGPNGAGKSTTLSIAATLLPADRGTVTIAGRRLPGAAREVRRHLGFVPQQVALYPALTATENLRFFGRMQGLTARAAAEAAARALALVALEGRAGEPVVRFSAGMRRRLNLACGILHRPRVLLLDEPTVGIDPQSRERIFDVAETLRREGAAILYSTHYMEEAERLCGRVVLLDAGRVAAVGTPAELVGRTGMTQSIHLRTVRPLPPGWLARTEGARIEGARILDGGGAETAIAVDDAAAVPTVLVSATRAGGEILELTLHRPNLADAFFMLTGRALRDEDAAPSA